MGVSTTVSRRGFIGGASALALSPMLAGAQTGGNALRPNVLFILVDDLRWNALSCMGHPFVKTPNVDRLAREGALFENAFVTTPLCSPSRASFLTGQYPHTHGIIGNERQYLRNFHKDTDLATFAEPLQKAGYTTAFIGKWHMDDTPMPRPHWDHWISFRGQGIYVDCPLNINGKSEPGTGYITDVLTDHALEFIARKHEKPWVLNLWHKAIHGPFTPAERHKDLFTGDTITWTEGAQDDLSGKLALTTGARARGANAARKGGGQNVDLIKNQLRCLTAIDDGLGRVLTALEMKGQLDNTLILFGSDNGYNWGEHGLGDKRTPYEESIRVPLVARYPKLIRAGSRPQGMALNVDIAPTLMELAGAPIPTTVHGKSLVPLFKGNETGWRDAALFEYFEEARFATVPEWQAVRTPSSAYIHYPGLEGMDELYDLKSDMAQMKNRVGDTALAETLRQRKTDRERLLRETAFDASQIPPRPTKQQVEELKPKPRPE